MKNFLKKIWTDGIADSIPADWWITIRAVNSVAILAILILFVVSMPTPDQEMVPWLLAAALQLVTVLTIHARADEIDRKMVEIDEENDRLAIRNFHHVEVVLQDVQWLVRREMARASEPTGDESHPDFVGPRLPTGE